MKTHMMLVTLVLAVTVPVTLAQQPPNIVKRMMIANYIGNNQLSAPTLLFTPKVSGLYRVTFFFNPVSSDSSGSGVSAQMQYTDQHGPMDTFVIGGQISRDNINGDVTLTDSVLIYAIEGTPVTVEYSLGPVGDVADINFIVESLGSNVSQ